MQRKIENSVPSLQLQRSIIMGNLHEEFGDQFEFTVIIYIKRERLHMCWQNDECHENAESLALLSIVRIAKCFSQLIVV